MGFGAFGVALTWGCYALGSGNDMFSGNVPHLDTYLLGCGSLGAIIGGGIVAIKTQYVDNYNDKMFSDIWSCLLKMLLFTLPLGAMVGAMYLMNLTATALALGSVITIALSAFPMYVVGSAIWRLPEPDIGAATAASTIGITDIGSLGDEKHVSGDGMLS